MCHIDTRVWPADKSLHFDAISNFALWLAYTMYTHCISLLCQKSWPVPAEEATEIGEVSRDLANEVQELYIDFTL